MSSRALSDSEEKPERSRNAKAQARHRAKRKAYIEELEETVTKLQSALGQFNLEHTMSVLPPPLAKIRELEQENARLQKQNDELQRLLADSHRRPPSFISGVGIEGRTTRNCDEDRSEYGSGSNKRRKMDGGEDPVYISRPGSSHSHETIVVPRAPPPGPGPIGGPTYHDSGPVPVPPYAHPHPHNTHPHGLDGPALHLPDSPPRYQQRDSEHDDHLTPVSGHPDAHANGHGHPDGHHYTLPPFKFSPLPEHDSWRPYAESERGP
ncbi:hypothetical protein B0H12DRAFT_1112948 [Mycena haematopus]|nr:hypothetical protein B0H12DRAFT_1112948 [Mycena haematopus]